MRHSASRRAFSSGAGYILALAIAVLVAGSLLVLIQSKPAATATILPTGFEDQVVANLGAPIGLASTPDGRLLVAQQHGKIRVFQNEALNPTPALDISSRICSNHERGLLGVAVDPEFPANGYVYVYYTYNEFGSGAGTCPGFDPANPKNPVNRVSRFVMSENTIVSSSEVVLVDNIPSFGRHNAGDLKFGKDGYLYVSVGDGGCDYAGDSGCASQNDASRDPHVLSGKLLRITRNGSAPADNPYASTGDVCAQTGRTTAGRQCKETFASGLRNPFRIAMDPDAAGTHLFINDVGGDAWEEVDEAEAGADYGWNVCEGAHDNPFRSGSSDCTAAPYTPPVFEYAHADTGCSSVTGAAFVPDGVWPAEYADSYLLGDYVCNKIFELEPQAGAGIR